MLAIKCDRCGAFEAYPDIYKYNSDDYKPANGSIRFERYDRQRGGWIPHDLCKSCLTQLDVWWKDKTINTMDYTALRQGFYKDVTDEMKEEVKEEIKKNEIDDILIEDLDFSSRCINILLRIGYKTLGDLRGHLTLSLLRKCRNCGPVAEQMIVDKLKEYGIEIQEGEEPKPVDLLPFKRS